MVAEISKDYGFPSVVILEGYIHSAATKTVFEISPFVFMPLYEVSLCGLGAMVFDVIQKEGEIVRSQNSYGQSFDVLTKDFNTRRF